MSATTEDIAERICPAPGGCDGCPDRAHCERLRSAPLLDLAESAWGIIANASGGNWDLQADDWKLAAAHWRDRYHGALRTALPRIDDLCGTRMQQPDGDVLVCDRPKGHWKATP